MEGNRGGLGFFPLSGFHNIFSHVRINSKKNDRKKIEECFVVLTRFGSFLDPQLLQVTLRQDRVRAWALSSTSPSGAASPLLPLPF